MTWQYAKEWPKCSVCGVRSPKVVSVDAGEGRIVGLCSDEPWCQAAREKRIGPDPWPTMGPRELEAQIPAPPALVLRDDGTWFVAKNGSGAH